MGIFDKFKNVFSSKEQKRYEDSLRRSRDNFGSKLVELTKRKSEIDDEFYDELLEILIMADVGVESSTTLLDRVRERARDAKLVASHDTIEIVIDELIMAYIGKEALSTKIDFADDLTVILVVGVNGVGKTTTIGKLAHKYQNMGKKVILAAGDTFRAGATKQLELWGEKVGCQVVAKEINSDPASVIYDAIAVAKEEKADVLICDTAGRLQNKVNLMQELEKIVRIIGREVPNAPQETLIVLDGTTGQNGIRQAEAFTEIADVTGIVLTKMDGASKGGIILPIRQELNLAVKYIGLGEQMEDLDEFDIEKYIYGLFANVN